MGGSCNTGGGCRIGVRTEGVQEGGEGQLLDVWQLACAVRPQQRYLSASAEITLTMSRSRRSTLLVLVSGRSPVRQRLQQRHLCRCARSPGFSKFAAVDSQQTHERHSW